MEYISSDTNVWIDFNIISRMNLPFLLPYTYIMYTESMESELLNPEGFKDQLAEAGLVGVSVKERAGRGQIKKSIRNQPCQHQSMQGNGKDCGRWSGRIKNG